MFRKSLLPLIALGMLISAIVHVVTAQQERPKLQPPREPARPGATAQAMVRGNPQVSFPLRFVRIEPYVVPKKSLTGDNTERVDTRVLQVIYAITPAEQPDYVGQQLDVFIDADRPAVNR